MEGNYLKIIFVIDQSGSMQGSESDVIGGFNNYIERQRKETAGKVTVSLYKFNSLVSMVITDKPISEIKNLSAEDYIPNGFTALYDAIGMAIRDTDNQIAVMENKEKPNGIMMVIITDGQENSSREFSSQALRTLIATHENLLHWNFIYLGTGLNDFTDADLLSLKYRASSSKVNLLTKFDVIADNTVSFRRKAPDNNPDDLQNLIHDLED